MSDDASKSNPRRRRSAATPAKVRLTDGLGPLPEARWKWAGEDAYSADQMRAYAEHAVARERQRTMFVRRPGLWALQAREVLELIAAPVLPDGTWNRDREACRQMAAEALGKYED